MLDGELCCPARRWTGAHAGLAWVRESRLGFNTVNLKVVAEIAVAMEWIILMIYRNI